MPSTPRSRTSSFRFAFLAIAVLSSSGPRATLRAAEAPRPQEPPTRSFLEVLESLGVAALEKEAARVPANLPFPSRLELPDADTIHGWVKDLASTAHRRPGTPEGQRASEWVKTRFRAVGLENVREERVPVTVWTPGECSLSVEGRRVPCAYVSQSGFTPSGGVKAPMVHVGEGGLSGFFGKDARRRIAVAEVPLSPLHDPQAFSFAPMPVVAGGLEKRRLAVPRDLGKSTLLDLAAQSRVAGAVAFVGILPGLSTEDAAPYWAPDARFGSLPAVYVGEKEGRILREESKAGRTVNLILTGSSEPGWSSYVWGVLPGVSKDVILVVGHYDSPYRGALGAASFAQLLAQAWAWSRLEAAARPKTLVFVASGCHLYDDAGARAFAKEHSDILAKTQAVLALDNLPARRVESRSSRKPANGGEPEASIIYTCRRAPIVAAVREALARAPSPSTASAPGLPELPISEVGGYLRWSMDGASQYSRRGGLPYVSWVGTSPHALGIQDTLDKVDRGRLRPTAETVSAMLQGFLMMP